MSYRQLALSIGVAVLLILFPAALAAQTNCDAGAGPLRTDQPQGMTIQDIIQKFTANESAFTAARREYSYTHDVTIQTLRDTVIPDKFRVDGEFRQVIDVSYDRHGKRLERVTFAPQSTLKRLSMSVSDLEDIRKYMPFMLTTEELPHYSLHYGGRQQVDELDTYVFDVAPKRVQENKRYFQGRIWVDSHDLEVVKTCGKSLPDKIRKNKKKKKKGSEDIHPIFVTYREQIDGRYRFPSFSRSDDILEFSTGDVRIREIIKYTNYQRSGAKPQVAQGEALSKEKPQ